MHTNCKAAFLLEVAWATIILAIEDGFANPQSRDFNRELHTTA